MEHEPHDERLPADEVALAAQRRERIDEGLEVAERTGRRIDDVTAKQIAKEFDPGSGPLHDFAETGAIPDGIEVDLDAVRLVLQDLDSEEHVPWVTALGEYFAGRVIKSGLPYWNDKSMK